MQGLAHGADFSVYQDDQHVHAAIDGGKLDFAFVKLTQGAGYANPRAAHQGAMMKARVAFVGAYHFLAYDVDGVAQWDHFEQQLRSHGTLFDGPLACDQETDRGVLVPDGIAQAFIRRGQQRGFKVGRYGDGRVFPRTLGEDWRWCAWWAKTPPHYRWDIWQFAAGEAGAPDWNVFRAARAELVAWAKRMRPDLRPRPPRPPRRWWLHDDLTRAARGPFRLAQLGPELIAYALKHPRSTSLRVERK